MATAPPLSDAVLVERLRRRDRTAWEELYQAYEERLYGFAFRVTGNPHDAADLVQETFVRALPRLDRVDPEGLNLSAYLFATAKNLFLKQVERRKRQEPVEEVPEPAEPAPIEEDPERRALLRRQQEEVRLANAKLAPRQRLVLALRELEGRSYAEIGELVGLNENAVAQLISRARLSLREELRLVQVDRSKLPKECQAMLPLLSAHLDGQLKGPKLERTLAHLEGCELCQAALSDLREAQRSYRALVPPAVGLLALREGVEDALAATRYWEGPRPRWRTRTALLAAGAGFLAFGSLGGGAAYLATREPPARPQAVPATRLAAEPATPTEEEAPAPAPRTTAERPKKVTTKAQAPTATSERAETEPAAAPVVEEEAAPATTPAKQPPTTATEPTPSAPPQTASAALTVSEPPATVTEPPSATATAPPATTEPAATTEPSPPPPPDLVISSATPTSFTVTNVGGSAAGPFVVIVKGGKAGVGRFAFGALAPGASVAQKLACSESARTAFADALNQVAESDEGNNSTQIPATVC